MKPGGKEKGTEVVTVLKNITGKNCFVNVILFSVREAFPDQEKVFTDGVIHTLGKRGRNNLRQEEQ